MWVCKNEKCKAVNSDNFTECQTCHWPKEGKKPRPTPYIPIVACCVLVIAVLTVWIVKLLNDKKDPNVETYSQAAIVSPSTPTPTQETASNSKYVWSEWSSWSTNPVTSSTTREVETRQSRSLIGYNMVHYGTQQAVEPYYRMFRDYSIGGNYSKYGARSSYTEKHLTKYVTVAQMNSATSYPANGALINLTYNGESYGGYQMGTTTAYNFGDDNKVWFIESEDYSVVTEYRHRDLIRVQ